MRYAPYNEQMPGAPIPELIAEHAELVLNLKTARALGLLIPLSFILLADRVTAPSNAHFGKIRMAAIGRVRP